MNRAIYLALFLFAALLLSTYALIGQKAVIGALESQINALISLSKHSFVMFEMDDSCVAQLQTSEQIRLVLER